MKRIAFVPYTPLGDAVLAMAQLDELHRVFEPCKITVFAVPLVAQLYGAYAPCDRVVAFGGGPRGVENLPDDLPTEPFDAAFLLDYDPLSTELVRRLRPREAYGMEEETRPPDVCRELFTRWVSIDFWKNETRRRWPLASQEMAEVIRLVSPSFEGAPPRLSRKNYRCERPEGLPDGDFALLLPGASAAFKKWPLDHYLSLAGALEERGAKAIFAVGPQDADEAAALANRPFPVFANLPIPRLAGLIEAARIVVGNDSGPMQLAACFAVPTLRLFANSGADVWFCQTDPWHRLLMPDCGIRRGRSCGDCWRECISEIPVDAALREIFDVFSDQPPTHPPTERGKTKWPTNPKPSPSK